nr:signal recognition particle-docking protein FtsY [Actinomyces sp. UMB0138]
MEQILQIVSRPEVWIPALVVVLILVVGGVVAHNRKQISPPPEKPQLPSSEGSVQGEAPVEPQTQPEKQAEPATQEPPRIEKPSGRMAKLRSRLSKSGVLGSALLSVLGKGDLSTSDWEEIEDNLLMADLGLDATEEVVSRLRKEVAADGTHDPQRVKEILRAALLEQVGPDMDRSINFSATDENTPGVMLVVGVNGTGKTTTIGKIARIAKAEDKKVVLGAADTFRAAAAEQLQTWAERVDVELVRSYKEGADPASVAFDAVKTGKEKGADVVIVDTAGRLQNKAGLMDELGKVARVIGKQAPLTEVLLVLDATTGQNGMQQARVFNEVVNLSGIVLTKLDGSAKGGIVVSVQRELGVPVKLVGLGEGADDLAPFDPQTFVDAIVGD